MAVDPFAGLWDPPEPSPPVYGPPKPWWIRVEQLLREPPKPTVYVVSRAQYEWLLNACEGKTRYQEPKK